eukprot:gene3933-biopygen2771
MNRLGALTEAVMEALHLMRGRETAQQAVQPPPTPLSRRVRLRDLVVASRREDHRAVRRMPMPIHQAVHPPCRQRRVPDRLWRNCATRCGL